MKSGEGWILEKLFIFQSGNCYHPVRYRVLTATNMKMTVFWDVAPCSLVDID
jgi:hypothetical protein